MELKKKSVVDAERYHLIPLQDQGTHSPSKEESLAKGKLPLQRQPGLCLTPLHPLVQDSTIGPLQLQSWGSDPQFSFSLRPILFDSHSHRDYSGEHSPINFLCLNLFLRIGFLRNPI